ncbi:hypothetical protein EYR40_010519 [Pleurotus pulmonarius]|nr:hypothetical protein EYR36_010092 [Pleurotus pulmonarius]KAF4588963.1 hypothetical protein EYR40_010519 [Pleurotus pulmonarius]
MDEDKPQEGGAFDLLSWTTPAQFHFVVDRYNEFVETARNDGERAKFWKALEDDWMSAWDLTPEITQKLRNYYYTIHAANINRGWVKAAADSVSELYLRPHEHQPNGGCKRKRDSNGGGSVNDAGKKILIDVPGFASSEIRVVLAAGDLLVHAEKNVTKGKGKENTFDDPLLPSKPLDEKVELPLGIQHADIRAKLDGGRLTFQILRNTTHRTHIVVEEIED